MSKWVLVSSLLGLGLFPLLAQAQTAASSKLPDGTLVRLKLMETVSSANASVGQQIPFQAVDEVDADGVPVIAKGAEAVGTVTLAKPKGHFGRGGKLNVNIDWVRLRDGEEAALRAVKTAEGGGHGGEMTAGIVVTGIVFFPAAPFFLFMHGKDITIPEGTVISAYVQGDVPLNLAKFAPAAPTPSTAGMPGGDAAAGAAAGAIPAAATTQLTLRSDPAGAEVDVDGDFVGETPATVPLPSGKHTIEVQAKGYAPWTRTIDLIGGSVNLIATLTSAGSATK